MTNNTPHAQYIYIYTYVSATALTGRDEAMASSPSPFVAPRHRGSPRLAWRTVASHRGARDLSGPPPQNARRGSSSKDSPHLPPIRRIILHHFFGTVLFMILHRFWDGFNIYFG